MGKIQNQLRTSTLDIDQVHYFYIMYKPQQVILKIQLPSVFTHMDQVDLQLLGFQFDPLGRLLQLAQKQKLYSQQDVGSLIKIIVQQEKRSIRLYDEKDWNNILRPLDSFAYQIELVVRVKNISQPSFQSKLLEFKPKSNPFVLVILENLSQLEENDVKQKIRSAALSLMKMASEKYFQNNSNVSLAPQKIFNPHLFIKTVQKDKYLEYYTKGIYEYYHYSDQSFNDHGWGCAYRSLQTLISWLNLQNHCKISKMPTITQLQQIIDRINLTSNQKLKNSRQWIGATEVSWVVKKLTNYDCRILHIADGKDIIEQCEVLRDHFEKVGCPVMYGGGQYAYSIVGLNYAWQLGECQFLILDPHYAGNDSLDKILEKKGLVWRKPDEMFKKGIFYNFCLPLIPSSYEK